MTVKLLSGKDWGCFPVPEVSPTCWVCLWAGKALSCICILLIFLPNLGPRAGWTCLKQSLWQAVPSVCILCPYHNMSSLCLGLKALKTNFAECPPHIISQSSGHSSAWHRQQNTDLSTAVLLCVWSKCSLRLRYCQRDLGTWCENGDGIN